MIGRNPPQILITINMLSSVETSNYLPQYSHLSIEEQGFLMQSDLQEALNQFDHSLALHNPQKAGEILHLLCVKSPENAEFPLKLGHLMYRQMNYAKAEYCYKYALLKNSENLKPEICFGLAQTYFQTKNYSDSFVYFKTIADSFPQYPLIDVVMFKLAMIYKISRDFENAVTVLLRLVRKQPICSNLLSDALSCLGQIYEIQGKMKNGLNCYVQACAASKTFQSISCLIWAYISRKPKFAENICQKYLKKKKAPYITSDIRFLQALACMKMEEFSKAAELIEEQLQAFPLNVWYAQYLGICYYRMKQLPKALAKFQMVSAVLPFSVENLNNLSVVFRDSGLENEFHQTYSLNLLMRNQMVRVEEFSKKTLSELAVKEPVLDIFDFPLNPTENL